MDGSMNFLSPLANNNNNNNSNNNNNNNKNNNKLDDTEVVHFPYENFYPFPYIMNNIVQNEMKEHRIQHLLETAEQAVVHAVHDEVEGLFPTSHTPTPTTIIHPPRNNGHHHHDKIQHAVAGDGGGPTNKQDAQPKEESFSFVQEYLKGLAREARMIE
mmetsp:Transcript_306/g.634  ORF Transcript_306/g.634 Transcript_306/m.634 type:complete len:158 (+) Transcript_306:1213-1686(+)